MKFKFPKIRWPRRKKEGNPSKAAQKTKEIAQKVFGFEKVDKGKYLKSADLKEDEVVRALAKLETDLNWVKRILWLIIAGSIASRYLG